MELNTLATNLYTQSLNEYHNRLWKQIDSLPKIYKSNLPPEELIYYNNLLKERKPYRPYRAKWPKDNKRQRQKSLLYLIYSYLCRKQQPCKKGRFGVLLFFSYICENKRINTQVFVRLADEPRKFIYGKRGRTLLRVYIFYIFYGYIAIARAVAFFFLPKVFLGPISGD